MESLLLEQKNMMESYGVKTFKWELNMIPKTDKIERDMEKLDDYKIDDKVP